MTQVSGTSFEAEDQDHIPENSDSTCVEARTPTQNPDSDITETAPRSYELF